MEIDFIPARILLIPGIRRVTQGSENGKKTATVVFDDGTHATKAFDGRDDYDIAVGVALCIAEKMFGGHDGFREEIDSLMAEPRPPRERPSGNRNAAGRKERLLE